MNIPLITLEPEWLKHLSKGSYQRIGPQALHEADGIIFLCPKCYEAKGSNVGVHSVICWFEGKVPDNLQPGPGRWTPRGSGFEDLTFVPGQRTKAVSVALTGGCQWHGHIANGFATD